MTNERLRILLGNGGCGELLGSRYSFCSRQHPRRSRASYQTGQSDRAGEARRWRGEAGHRGWRRSQEVGRQDDGTAIHPASRRRHPRVAVRTATRACTECVGHVVQALTGRNQQATIPSIGGVGAYDLISRNAMSRGVTNIPDGGKMVLLVRLFCNRPSTHLWEDKGFLWSLACEKARDASKVLHGSARAAWCRTWSCLPACAAAKAFASSLVHKRSAEMFVGCTRSSVTTAPVVQLWVKVARTDFISCRCKKNTASSRPQPSLTCYHLPPKSQKKKLAKPERFKVKPGTEHIKPNQSRNGPKWNAPAQLGLSLAVRVCFRFSLGFHPGFRSGRVSVQVRVSGLPEQRGVGA